MAPKFILGVYDIRDPHVILFLVAIDELGHQQLAGGRGIGGPGRGVAGAPPGSRALPGSRTGESPGPRHRGTAESSAWKEGRPRDRGGPASGRGSAAREVRGGGAPLVGRSSAGVGRGSAGVREGCRRRRRPTVEGRHRRAGGAPPASGRDALQERETRCGREENSRRKIGKQICWANRYR